MKFVSILENDQGHVNISLIIARILSILLPYHNVELNLTKHILKLKSLNVSRKIEIDASKGNCEISSIRRSK